MASHIRSLSGKFKRFGRMRPGSLSASSSVWSAVAPASAAAASARSAGTGPAASRGIASGRRDDPAGPVPQRTHWAAAVSISSPQELQIVITAPPAQHDQRYLRAAKREYRRVNAAARPSAGGPWPGAMTSLGAGVPTRRHAAQSGRYLWPVV